MCKCVNVSLRVVYIYPMVLVCLYVLCVFNIWYECLSMWSVHLPYGTRLSVRVVCVQHMARVCPYMLCIFYI